MRGSGWQPGATAVAGDFNGDGNIDAATLAVAASSVQIRLGNGNGDFGSQTSLSLGITSSDIKTGDINGDGILDIVTAGTVVYAGYVSVLLGTG